jgi:hypothetical protein
MHRTPLSIPEIALIGGTRAALGAGLALLLADRLSRDQRQAIGWTLFGVGAVTTVPILAQLLKSQSEPAEHAERGAPRADLEYARHFER